MLGHKTLYNFILTGITRIRKGDTLTAAAGSTVTLAGTNSLTGGTTITTVKTSDVKIGAAGSETSLTVPVAIRYVSTTPTENVVVVDRAYYLSSIKARVSTASDTAGTLTFYKIPSGTSGVGSGTQVSTGSFNLSASTALVVQSIAVTASTTALTLATGDGLGYVLTGAATNGGGSITFNLKPI